MQKIYKVFLDNNILKIKLLILFQLIFIQNTYADEIKIIDNYNKNCTAIFEKYNFSDFINLLETSTSKEIGLSKIICSRVFSDSVFKFNEDNERIEVVKFKNKDIEGKFKFYFYPTFELLSIKLNKFKSINGYNKKIYGFLFFYKNNFYFVGKWPHSRGTSEKYKRISSLIKFSKSFEFLSLLQFNFIKEINGDFKYQHILQESKDLFIYKRFNNFEDAKFIFYLNKLDSSFNKQDKGVKKAILSPVGINKILLMSGNVFFNNIPPVQSKKTTN